MNIVLQSTDPVVIKVCEQSCACVKGVQEAGTSYNDVKITWMICCSIVAIAIVGMLLAFIWAWQERCHKACEAKLRHDWEAEDAERKKRYDLIDKRLEALKNQTEIKDDKGKVTGYTSFTSDEFNAYNDAIEAYKKDLEHRGNEGTAS